MKGTAAASTNSEALRFRPVVRAFISRNTGTTGFESTDSFLTAFAGTAADFFAELFDDPSGWFWSVFCLVCRDVPPLAEVFENPSVWSRSVFGLVCRDEPFLADAFEDPSGWSGSVFCLVCRDEPPLADAFEDPVGWSGSVFCLVCRDEPPLAEVFEDPSVWFPLLFRVVCRDEPPLVFFPVLSLLEVVTLVSSWTESLRVAVSHALSSKRRFCPTPSLVKHSSNLGRISGRIGSPRAAQENKIHSCYLLNHSFTSLSSFTKLVAKDPEIILLLKHFFLAILIY